MISIQWLRIPNIALKLIRCARGSNYDNARGRSIRNGRHPDNTRNCAAMDRGRVGRVYWHHGLLSASRLANAFVFDL